MAIIVSRMKACELWAVSDTLFVDILQKLDRTLAVLFSLNTLLYIHVVPSGPH